MPRYIDAETLKQRIKDNWYTATEIIDDVDAEPTVDVVKVKHGKWESGTYNSFKWLKIMTVKCSCCEKESVALFSTDGNLWNIEMCYDFCPNCGADMRKEKTE